MRNFLWVVCSVFIFQTVMAQDPGLKLKISPLIPNFYVYTTYNLYQGEKIPANGMYVVTHEGVVLFDTPWDTTQFQPLLDSIEFRHHKKVVLCIATHFHDDRTAGFEYYRKQGIKTYTTTLTDELSRKNHQKRAKFLIGKDTVFQVGGQTFETYYPGEGHTRDNIVLWFKKERILYGGCLIKGADAESLGYLGDANVKEYEATLRKVQAKCPNPSVIIVSHSDWNNINSLKHSIKLAAALRKKNQ